MRRATPLRALGAAVLAVSLAGCVKMDMQLELNTDDTVDGSMIFAISRDMAEMAESMGEDPSSMFGDMEQEGLPEDFEMEDYEDDDYIGQRYTFDGADLSEFDEAETGFQITHEGEEFVVAGELDMSDIDPEGLSGEDMQGLEEELGADMGDLGDLEGMMDSFDMNVSITFPGAVLEHNGELDGTTVTWVPVAGENLEINARSEESGGGGGDGIPVWIWILIIVVVLGLAGLLFFLSRNRNQGPAEPATPDAAGVVPPPPGATPEPPVTPEPEPLPEPEPTPAEPEPLPSEPEPLPAEPDEPDEPTPPPPAPR